MSHPAIAHRRQKPRGDSNQYDSTDYVRERQPGRRPPRGHAGLSRTWLTVIGASVGTIVVAAGAGAVPKLMTTATTTATPAITQVGTATTFESRRAVTAVTTVPRAPSRATRY
jgi:hypothetical protein